MTNPSETANKEHLLNCLARHLNTMSKSKLADFGQQLKKHHDKKFLDDLRDRMIKEKRNVQR